MALILGEKSSLYLAYGAEEMAYAEYSPLSGEPRTLRVTVFRMGSPLGAFGVLSRERGFLFRASPHITPFDDSYAAPGGLYFRHGNLYVAVTSSRSDGTSVDECREFAHIVTGGIPDLAPRADLPEFTGLFGSPGARNDLVYFPGRHPDIPALRDAFSRARQFGGETRTVIFARRGTKAVAMRDFTACMESPGLPLALSGAGEYRTALGRRGDGSYVVLAQSGEWIFGVSDAPDMPGGERIVRELHGELVSYLSKKRQ
jgi:hypothetical protein